MPSPHLLISEIIHTFTGSLTDDGNGGVHVAGFIPYAHPLRHSVTDYYTPLTGYYNSLSNISSAPLILNHPPPSYYDVQDQPSLPPARFPVTPREEEGREQLPPYSCSVHREAVFHTKMELSSPFEKATDRSWRKEYVVLHGTLLRMHKPRRIPFFSTPEVRSGQGEDGSARPDGWMPGELLRKYTLQGAEVGIAGDYKKRHFVIRVRAETEQFLLSSKRVDEFMAWLEALSAAVDLSPSLDERSLPRYQTIPRRRRRRDRQVISEQERIIRSHFPYLNGGLMEDDWSGDHAESRPHSNSTSGTAGGPDSRRRTGVRRLAGARVESAYTAHSEYRDSQESITEQDLQEFSAEMASSSVSALPHSAEEGISSASSLSNATVTTSSTASSPAYRARIERSSSSSSETTPRSSQSQEAGRKWRPVNTLTPEANLRYARRCMAVLCGNSPRQSNFIIKDGRRYRIIWEKKEIVPEDVDSGVILPHSTLDQPKWKLPRYEEIFASEAAGRVAVVVGLGLAVPPSSSIHSTTTRQITAGRSARPGPSQRPATSVGGGVVG